MARRRGERTRPVDRPALSRPPRHRRSAAARLRGERGTSLSTDDLINDAVLRLIRIERIDIADRVLLIALASRMMRNILVGHARLRSTDKRRHQKVELCTDIDREERIDLNRLDSALIRLSAIDGVKAFLPGLQDKKARCARGTPLSGLQAPPR